MLTEEDKRRNAEALESMRPRFRRMTEILKAIMEKVRIIRDRGFPTEACCAMLKDSVVTTTTTLGMFDAAAALAGFEQDPDAEALRSTLSEALELLKELGGIADVP